MKVKVCGLTRLEDAELAVELGAWALGFVFYKSSPRVLRPSGAKMILGQLRSRGSTFTSIGVFVNEDVSVVQAYAQEIGLDAVQLHGEENAEYCDLLKKVLPAVDIIKAARPASFDDLASLKKFQKCDGLLLDTFVEGQRGGTGVENNFALVSDAQKLKLNSKIILSGGLKAENIDKALGHVRPYALDISSGVESAPGIKDPQKMHEFFNKVKTYVK